MIVHGPLTRNQNATENQSDKLNRLKCDSNYLRNWKINFNYSIHGQPVTDWSQSWPEWVVERPSFIFNKKFGIHKTWSIRRMYQFGISHRSLLRFLLRKLVLQGLALKSVTVNEYRLNKSHPICAGCWWQLCYVGDRFNMLTADAFHWKWHQHDEQSNQYNVVTNMTLAARV